MADGKTIAAQISMRWLGLLGVILCGAKALGLAPPELTWFYATLPFWIGPAAFVALLLCVGVFYAGFSLMILLLDAATTYLQKRTAEMQRRRLQQERDRAAMQRGEN